MSDQVTNDFSDSIVQLSDEQFYGLKADAQGYVVNLHLCYHVMTEGQIEALRESDRVTARLWQNTL